MKFHGRRRPQALLIVIALVFLLSGCHSSKLHRADADRGVADYRLLVVGGFPARDDAPKAGRATVQDATAAGQRFAVLLERELRAHGVRGTIRRGEAEPGALLIAGEVTGYDPGNALLRGVVGFGLGGADFEATVRLVDAGSGDELGRIELDKASFPVAGVAGALHDIDILMQAAAERAAMEVAIAQGVLERGFKPASKVRKPTGCGRGGPQCGQYRQER